MNEVFIDDFPPDSGFNYIVKYNPAYKGTDLFVEGVTLILNGYETKLPNRWLEETNPILWVYLVHQAKAHLACRSDVA